MPCSAASHMALAPRSAATDHTSVPVIASASASLARRAFSATSAAS